jgi:hypothetical protein
MIVCSGGDFQPSQNPYKAIGRNTCVKFYKATALIALITAFGMIIASCASGAMPPDTAQTSADTNPPAVTATPVPATQAAPSATPATKEPLGYSDPQKYSVKYSVIINNTGFSPTDIRLYLPLPAEWDAQKELKIAAIAPEPKSKAAEPVSGNSMLYWQLLKTPKKGSAAEFTLNFEFTAYETNTNIDPASVQPYDKSSVEVQRYTKPEKYIESGDPKITALADSLAAGETNPYLQAQKFYDYIIDHTTYKLLGQGLNGAKYLLENGKGECGDYSALFIALCRAKGIPARPVVGYWAISGNDQTHVWAEFFLQGIGWVPVDATIGQQGSEKRAYYFGNMDNQRVILSKGYNTPLVPATKDKFVAPILQVPLWWFWGSGDANTLTMERNWEVSKIQ